MSYSRFLDEQRKKKDRDNTLERFHMAQNLSQRYGPISLHPGGEAQSSTPTSEKAPAQRKRKMDLAVFGPTYFQIRKELRVSDKPRVPERFEDVFILDEWINYGLSMEKFKWLHRKGNLHLTLETLPSDMIVQILFSFDSFDSLYKLITLSAVYYRNFFNYPNSILLQVAKRILGNAWDDATTLLVWQRHSNNLIPNYDAVKEDLKTKFVLHRKDIPQLLANQKFFDSCSRDFTTFIAREFPQARKWRKELALLAPTSSVLTAHQIAFKTHDFVTEGVLPAGLFYKMWLLHLQFRYESIEVFATHQHISEKLCADLRLVSQIMQGNSNFKDFIFLVKGTNAPEKLLSRELFGSLWPRLVKHNSNRCRGLPQDSHENHFLRLKMLSHIAAVAAGGMTLPQTNLAWFNRVSALHDEFISDYAKMSVKGMVGKYGIS